MIINKTSDRISIVALVISILSIYFSVFYKNHDLSISTLDSRVDYLTNKMSIDILLYNKGNSYSTVISKYLIFYQDQNWENTGVIFVNGEPVYEPIKSPVILQPNEQVLDKVTTTANFKKTTKEYKRRLDFNKKIKVGLVATYINPNGYRTGELFEIGFVTLDDNKMIKNYKIDYDIFNLNSWDYYGSTRGNRIIK